MWWELIAFTGGACIGSFLNVVIHRTPRRLSVIAPGSRCPECGMPVRWYDNIPLIS
ncbi:MAG: prepilin peptidase, partial [Nitrospinae bacterium]|nr:prepilin peptidase [Nitrospinota bacterium]